MEAQAGIDHVFVTHSHLDHIAAMPFLVDAVGEMRDKPLTVHASPATIRILRSHVFNWLIWPDFTTVPDSQRPYLRFQPLNLGESVRLPGRRTVTAMPAYHAVPTQGYCLDSGSGQLVYTGDTGYSSALVDALNALPNLSHLIVESAFPDEQRALALASRHLCPSMLTALLGGLRSSPHVHVTHLKPGKENAIIQQIAEQNPQSPPSALGPGDEIVF